MLSKLTLQCTVASLYAVHNGQDAGFSCFDFFCLFAAGIPVLSAQNSGSVVVLNICKIYVSCVNILHTTSRTLFLVVEIICTCQSYLF